MDISLDEDLEIKFRRAAMKQKGYKKGALKEAMREAITEWLRDNE